MGRALLQYVLENQEEDPLVKESFEYFLLKYDHVYDVFDRPQII